VRPGALIAPAWRPAALLRDLWQQAVEIRREWLEIGLSTEPADRSTAESAITAIYVRHRRARPAFVWVDSPRAALPHLAGLPTHQTLRTAVAGSPGRPPIASDIAAGLSHLRSALIEGYTEPPPDRKPMKRPKGDPWPELAPAEAIKAGLPFHELLRQGVREALFRSLAHGVYLPIRAALGPTAEVPVGWYGNQDAAWIAHLEAMRRLGLTPTRNQPRYDVWRDLTRSAGWWWPAEDHCILSERPAIIRTEPIPNARHEEIRAHHDQAKPAIEYRDGWST